MGCWVRSGILTMALACAMAGSPAAPSQEEPSAANPARGKALSYTCLGCHGIAGYKNAYPNYSVPKLEGQHPEYLVIALQAYKSGERAHMTMHSQASSLSDQDMADIAAFFAGEPLRPNPQSERSPPQAVAQCVACHGADGIGIVAQYPTLAGQHADYLARSLQQYKIGARKNAVMATFAAALKEAEIAQIAEYYSQQQPALETVERPFTRLAAER